MRKFVLSFAAAGTAIAFATPAAAQYYPQGQAYGGYNSGNGYNGYVNYYGQIRALQARIDRVQWQIDRLGRYNGIRGGGSNRLREESRNIERRLQSASRHGLSPYEASDISARIARLEQRVQFASANRYGRYGQNGYGYNGYSNGNGYGSYNAGNGHRDGNDDRYENDQGRDHTGRFEDDQGDDHDD